MEPNAGIGLGAIGLVALIAWFIGKQQFPNEPMWQLIVVVSLTMAFVGFGGMDWFTYGEWQGMPWEQFDGQRWRYEPGVGWSR